MSIVGWTDECGGMQIHRRRQSQDRILRERILTLTGGRGLWMNAYSFGQFQDGPTAGIRVDESFLQKAGRGEYCFVEDQPLDLGDERIESVIRYCWNRSYPGDLFLDQKELNARFRLIRQEEFPGNSHEKITEEVYIR